jgi:hypothetical protein
VSAATGAAREEAARGGRDAAPGAGEPAAATDRPPARDLFAQELAALEDRLAVPYPDRALLLEELASDLGEAYDVLAARGLAEPEARQAALRGLALDDETVRALEDVHTPVVLRALARLPRPVRQWLEAFATAAPLAALFFFLIAEVPLSSFVREGGGAAVLVTTFGMLGLFVEFQRLFIWFVLRDHSVQALRRNTPTPLYLAAATMLLGFLGAALKLYAFLPRWATGVLPPGVQRQLLSEALACLILASALAALTVLLHGALAVGLRAIRIPDAKQKAD